MNCWLGLDASGDGEDLVGGPAAGVISAVEASAARRAATDRFGIGVATAVRWLRAFRAIGAMVTLPEGGDLRSHRIEAFRRVILDVRSQGEVGRV